jgi:hypothetical protein
LNLKCIKQRANIYRLPELGVEKEGRSSIGELKCEPDPKRLEK